MKRRNFILEGLSVIVPGLAIGLGARALYDLHKDRLTSQDFEDSTWLPYHNKNGRIWSCYTNENISHNQDNWNLYQKKVSEKNKRNLEGHILLPDLDKTGSVGK